jgi:DNA mismatch repair protein MutS2
MIAQHTLQTLEFPKVIAAIREHCITPYGSPEVDRFAPMFDRQQIETRLTEISQMKDIINFGRAFPLSRMEDSREYLDKTLVEGAFLDPEEIRVVLELVEVSMSLHDYYPEGRDNYPAIAAYLNRIRAFPELKTEIRRAIDDDGSIKDSASPALRHIRNDLADSKRRIIARLESILSSHKKQTGWQDDVVTQRDGRYVIPVLAGHYKADEGILHDRSQSGATFYIEPKETIELNNRLHLLEQEERAEIIRILRALSAEIAKRAEALKENTNLIGILDAFHAVARFAVDTRANAPRIDDSPRFELIDARHPLLILQFRGIDKVVPLSLRLDQYRLAVLITGPNTGGKTIALKTIGLMVVMAQSGLLIPAGEKSIVGIFEQIHADIGDEQSIELSLSTFSSHVRNISKALTSVSSSSLVLLDEIGAGTDPKEGAALAEAIILYLVDRGARVLSSTHYSQLKTLALDHPEIENASLEFDRQSLAPTFRLQMGIPGSSYAVEIASRLGMPQSICEHAGQLLGSSERSLGDLIASLQAELAVVREDRIKLTERLAKAERIEEHYRTESEKLQRDIDQTRQQALKETDELLDSTRKEIERLVAELRTSQASPKSVKSMHQFLRERTEHVGKVRKHTEGKPEQQFEPTHFGVGDSVRIISINQEGEIVELIGEQRARVQVGAVNTVVEIRNLEKLSRDAQRQSRRVSATSLPTTGELSPEIHLRGMTAEEGIEALDQFLDRAVVAGLTQVYVVHGKGTGALRKALTEYLRHHPEVSELRLGDWNEGGAGVTIVKLKA